LYIEGCDDYVKIYLQEQKTLVARMTMKSIQERLPARDFIRVHRSFIISVSRIESVRNKTIFICDREIPIGSSYEEGVMAFIRGT
jgi:DNA-binding LytR/AlgR family response regulator